MKLFRLTTYVVAPDARTAYILRDLGDSRSVSVEEARSADPSHERLIAANRDITVGAALVDLARSSC